MRCTELSSPRTQWPQDTTDSDFTEGRFASINSSECIHTRYNSGNHLGDGQNVGFGDDHVTWETSPYVGENGDNIFTYHNYGANNSVFPVNGTTDMDQIGLYNRENYQLSATDGPAIRTLAPPFDTCMSPVRAVNPTALNGTDIVW